MNYLPHRQPFLFVDKILDVSVPLDENGKVKQVGTTVIGQKNATINEPYFTGHFPGLPITPGVVILETFAQVASFAVLPWVQVDKDLRVLSKFELRLAGVDKNRFRRPFYPGDSLKVTTVVMKQRGPIWAFECKGEIDGQLTAEAEILASIHLS
jgi:3-hydroxyacyl-[acyl-carrier-protein] dehydratase